MRPQRANRPHVRGEFKRQMIRIETVGTGCDERAERLVDDQLVKNLGTVLFEMGWDVHGALRVREGGESCKRYVCAFALASCQGYDTTRCCRDRDMWRVRGGLGTTWAEPPPTDACPWTERSAT